MAMHASTMASRVRKARAARPSEGTDRGATEGSCTEVAD
jgi:hypothetical protein